ncbi:MAG: adenylate/guanylate cyclase domain-containing protein [Rhodocyclaceae bacterium]|nr:adenylate/guanylate cyclase domain-containing protein [Rhodocyclaceae bacterium]
MKKLTAPILIGLVLTALMLMHAQPVYRYQFDLVSRLDAVIYDEKLRLTMPKSEDSRLVILDIDEKSLSEHGHWPWGRDKMAHLMDQLFDHYGVRVVGFDVVFAEKDDSSGLKTLEELSKTEFRDIPKFQTALHDLKPQLDYDGRFAAALRNRNVILGYYLANAQSGRNIGVMPAPTFKTGTFDGRNIDFVQWLSHGANIATLQNAAAGAGHFIPLIDSDGLARRVPMIVEYQGQYYESLSLAIVRNVLGKNTIEPGYPEKASSDYKDMEWLSVKPETGGTMRIPVDANVASFIPFRGGARSFPYVSVTDVMTGKTPREALAGKIVIVGTTASGLVDLRATPVDRAYPGVEIHANLVMGMLDNVIKYKPVYIWGVDALLILAVGLLMSFGLPRLTPLKASFASLILLVVLLAINFTFWYSGNVIVPLAASLVLAFSIYAINMSWGYFVESRTKRQLTGLFGQYVPPELVEQMSLDPENYSMAGRKAELTVLFSDVRGFTTISEGLEPDQLATLMNEYLGAMTIVVRKHRGTLDKYIGDAIMAFWGAPVDDPHHARNATLTGLEMHVALKELNKSLVSRGWPDMKIGVGINSGPMTVGDMGSKVRQSYTVMGDAVNLGSRLESITKQYGVGFIAGESSRDLVKDEFVFRELDRVRVKGKEDPVSIYEPIGAVGEVAPEIMKELKLWSQALTAYRSQNWDQADVHLLNLTRMNPHYLYEMYSKRIGQYRLNPPGEDWDGVTTFETK